MNHRLAAAGLLALGLAQMTGDLTGLAALKGIAAATAASPAPKVFSAVRGLETYSTRFFVQWTTRDGSNQFYEITPERYARLRGPYNRRNVYGAALAYGPVLATQETTEPMLRSVMMYALCGQAPLLREMGIDTSTIASSPAIRYAPRAGAVLGDMPLLLTAPCESDGPDSHDIRDSPDSAGRDSHDSPHSPDSPPAP